MSKEVKIGIKQLESILNGNDFILDLGAEYLYIEYDKILKENMPKRIELDLK